MPLFNWPVDAPVPFFNLYPVAPVAVLKNKKLGLRERFLWEYMQLFYIQTLELLVQITLWFEVRVNQMVDQVANDILYRFEQTLVPERNGKQRI